MEYRRGRITRDYRRWGRPARLARFRARSHSRNAWNQGDRRDVSNIYLNYLVGQILIGGSGKRGTSRLSPSLHLKELLVGRGIQLHCQGSQVSRPGTISYSFGRLFLVYSEQQDKGP